MFWGEKMKELEIFDRFNAISVAHNSFKLSDSDKVSAHKMWLNSIRRERPSTSTQFRIGVYIRYFNQTKYEDYLSYHKKQFIETIALCPNWSLVDFYIDEGFAAPNMESSKEWCRLLDDCLTGKVNLIITQKISNVSRKQQEMIFCARLLASQKPPIGIYFISEDIFTLSSYYLNDKSDSFFLPDSESNGGYLND